MYWQDKGGIEHIDKVVLWQQSTYMGKGDWVVQVNDWFVYTTPDFEKAKSYYITVAHCMMTEPRIVMKQRVDEMFEAKELLQ